MQLTRNMLFAGVALCCLLCAPAQAETKSARPTKAQMEAIHACAAAKDVELPAPPAERLAREGKGAVQPVDAAPKDGAHRGYHRTKLTDEQRSIIDSCFKEQGLTPPPHRAARAEGGFARPTKAQREAIHACAAAKGVELPAPPAERLAREGKDGVHRGYHRTKLTDEQRSIIDSCFKEQGLTPPPHRK